MGLFGGDGSDDPSARRESMVADLRERGRVTDETVLAAMATVPRHAFVPEQHRDRSYADRPLAIGEGQTISAPHMVGIMAELLSLSPGQRVLEVGTGCGYHAAVTAELVGADGVYSVEYHDSLAEQARERLAELGYGGVSIRVGDGHDGWPEHAPYDRAYLTCAPATLPDRVLDQLRPGGRIVAPVGRGQQELVVATKRDDGSLDRRTHGGVRFVPMVGGEE
jgi:protein-L-isoaspartate(D-aspartate) O-methyltransferase